MMPPFRFLGKFSPLKVQGCATWNKVGRGTTVIGGQIAEVLDGSSNGCHLSRAEMYRPTYSESLIGGRPGGIFTVAGNKDLAFSAEGLNLVRNVSVFSVLLVFRPTTTILPGYYGLLRMSTGTNVSARRFQVGTGNNSNELFATVGSRLDSDSEDYSLVTGGYTATDTVLCVVCDYANALLRVWKNGTLVKADDAFTTGGGPTSNTASLTGGIGMTNGSDFYWSELAAWKRGLSDDERKYLQYGCGREYSISIAV